MGFAGADASFVLFLNPDTEIRSGTFADLLETFRDGGDVGLIGCRQVAGDGQVCASIRRFPTPLRTLLEALGSEHFPVRASWMGERELNRRAYDREAGCDWVSGSFMLARREAVVGAGGWDERYFCRRGSGPLRGREGRGVAGLVQPEDDDRASRRRQQWEPAARGAARLCPSPIHVQAPRARNEKPEHRSDDAVLCSSVHRSGAQRERYGSEAGSGARRAPDPAREDAAPVWGAFGPAARTARVVLIPEVSPAAGLTREPPGDARFREGTAVPDRVGRGRAASVVRPAARVGRSTADLPRARLSCWASQARGPPREDLANRLAGGRKPHGWPYARRVRRPTMASC